MQTLFNLTNMKADIIFPFIDLRKLYSNRGEFVNRRPSWPAPFEGFMRCTGMVNSRTSGFAYKGIRLVGNKIPGLIKLKRKIEFPFLNNVFGLYSISFTLKKNSFSKESVEDILQYFQNEILFRVVNLVNSTNGSKSVNLKGLKKELLLQYYWASRKLVDNKNGKQKELYIRNKDGIISVTQLDDELKYIKMIKPLIFLETTNNKHTYNKTYRSIFFNTWMCKNSNLDFDIYHLKRNWNFVPVNLQRISFFTHSFLRYDVFFNSFYKLIEELNNKIQVDPVYIDNLTVNLVNYCYTVSDHHEYGYFVSYYNFLLSGKNQLLQNLVAKVNHSTALYKNQKDLLNSAINQLFPYKLPPTIK